MTPTSLNAQYPTPLRRMFAAVIVVLVAVSPLTLARWSAQATEFVNTQGGVDSVAAPLFVNEQQLTASDGVFGDGFGHSVAFSGSTVVVGSPGDDIFKGSIYVFNRQGGSWVEEQKLTASDGAPVDFFGFSVAVGGSTIVVGSENGGNIGQGTVYIFEPQR